MIKLLNITLLFSILVFILYSCTSREKSENKNNIINDSKSLENINKFLVRKDAEAIQNYIERRKWKMETTESGLYYMIYRKGNGKPAKSGHMAFINYETGLLDGTVCYKSDSLAPYSFIIGKGGIESGIEEGILLLKEGDRAKFILPPHLAHGLTGDNKKIPPRAVVVYDLELIKTEEGYE
ncbi:MAG: FKBP-type peptidyl-prolyl cis-trans isomerase [Bacteroidales bacterium]|nr:FKBP-type peptidyl-prolyl cis-trans isomerase [Bacteroidales bacterium]